MPDSSLAEIYFIAGMMILILILCTGATYLFFKTFYTEKRMREEERRQKKLEKEQKSEVKK
ncbi:MAG: hypothetical protein M3405_14780 [Acidobacteriota bacterium]|jgi:sortase (surface protein transpeptidase)|nr:hypothetical protein [Acidobacteriota bacterium]